jgi:ADP-heptose:LPS heptosyltransferase
MKPLIANRKKRFALQAFNLVTSLLFLPKKIFRKPVDFDNINPTKILLIRLDYIGDVVMTSPTFPLLKQRFPDASISLLTNSIAKQLLQGDKNIDNIYVFNWPWRHLRKSDGFTFQKIKVLIKLVAQLRREKFDMVVDFRGDIRFLLLFGVFIGAKVKLSNSRSGNRDIPDHVSAYDIAKHEVERTQDIIKCVIQTEKYTRPNIQITRQKESEAIELLEKITGSAFSSNSIVVAPFSSKDIKSWPLAHFQRVISYLSSRHTIFIVGTSEDEPVATALIDKCENVFSLAGKTSIVQLAAVTKLCSLVVGIDTGVLHIASCFSTPILAIFGPTRSIEYRPYSPLCTVVENEHCTCDQFTHAKCDRMTDGYAGCLKDLGADLVINQLEKMSF